MYMLWDSLKVDGTSRMCVCVCVCQRSGSGTLCEEWVVLTGSSGLLRAQVRTDETQMKTF